MDQDKVFSFSQGAVLSRATLRRLIERRELVILYQDRALAYDGLVSRDQIDETSISLHIGALYRYSQELHALDIRGKYDLENHYELREPDEGGGIIVEPGDFLLGKTLERITAPQNVIGIVEERRTVAGSLGLLIKGSVPPGLIADKVRFTLLNSGSLPVKLYVGKVPPIKVVFHSMSSSEVYGRGRETRVSKDQVYSGGAGDLAFSRLGAVVVSFSVDDRVTVRQPLTVNFRLENVGAVPVERTRIYPLLNKDAFRITSCSLGWKLEQYRASRPLKGGLFSTSKRPWDYMLGSQVSIDPKETFHGSFDIQFLKSLSLPRFRIRVECLSDEKARIPVKYLTEGPPLTVAARFPLLRKQAKDYLVSAVIAAVIYGLISKFGPSILDSLKRWLEILFDMMG